MLVISRKFGESFYIGNDIKVTVVKIDENKVRIGIDAPREVPVWRSELMPEVVNTIYGPVPVEPKE